MTGSNRSEGFIYFFILPLFFSALNLRGYGFLSLSAFILRGSTLIELASNFRSKLRSTSSSERICCPNYLWLSSTIPLLLGFFFPFFLLDGFPAEWFPAILDYFLRPLLNILNAGEVVTSGSSITRSRVYSSIMLNFVSGETLFLERSPLFLFFWSTSSSSSSFSSSEDCWLEYSI
jgi:hypothetical protein